MGLADLYQFWSRAFVRAIPETLDTVQWTPGFIAFGIVCEIVGLLWAWRTQGVGAVRRLILGTLSAVVLLVASAGVVFLWTMFIRMPSIMTKEAEAAKQNQPPPQPRPRFAVLFLDHPRLANDESNSTILAVPIAVANHGPVPSPASNWEIAVQRFGSQTREAMTVYNDRLPIRADQIVVFGLTRANLVIGDVDLIARRTIAPIKQGYAVVGILCARLEGVPIDAFRGATLHIRYQDNTGHQYSLGHTIDPNPIDVRKQFPVKNADEQPKP